MSVRKKFISGFSWQTVNVLTQISLQLIFISVLARLISKEAFGIMSIALVVVSFIEIFSQIGIGPALIHRKNLTPQQINGAFFISLILGIGFTLLLYAISPMVANYYDYPPLSKILRVIGISFLISSISIVPRSLIVKEMNFKNLFVASTIAMSIGNIGIGITMAVKGYDLWAYVFALLSQNAIMTICFWFYHPLRIRWDWSWSQSKSMMIYGGGSTIFNLFNFLASKIDTMIIGKFGGQMSTGTTWENTGVYDRSVYLMGLPITVLGKLSDSVLFSGLSMIQDEKDKLRRAFLSATYFISILIIPSCAFIIFYSEEIIVLFLGDKYISATPIVQILFLGVAFRSLIKLCDSLVRALNALYYGSIIKFIFFLMIGAGTFFILPYGLEAVAWVVVISTFVQYVFITALCLTRIDLKYGLVLKKMIPALSIAILVLLSCFISTSFLDNYTLPHLLRLLIGLAFSCALLLATVLAAPWMFGKGQDNLLRFAINKFPQHRLMRYLANKLK